MARNKEPAARSSRLSTASTGRGVDMGPVVELYRSHYVGLVRLAGLLVDDRGTAEEAVQDAFVSFARGQHADDPAAQLAYLRSAVMNNARSELRKRQVRRRHLRSIGPPPSSPGADRSVLLDDEHRQIIDRLRQLPQRQREVLVLRFYEDLSEQEIASTLGISAGSVKTHAHRGLQRLEALLGTGSRPGDDS